MYTHQRFNYGLLLFAMFCLSLTSCSFSPEKEQVPVEEPAEVVEIPSREAIFIYSGDSENLNEIVLDLGAEARLLGESYFKLIGIVKGNRPTALVEVGGRGWGANIGEQVMGYKVTKIEDNRITLKAEKTNGDNKFKLKGEITHESY